MTFLTLTVPLVAPSVNHYMRLCRGRHVVTAEARRFKKAVAVAADGRNVEGKRYVVAFTVYLAAKQRGDADNFAKCIQDALVEAGVIKTDAWVFPTVCNKARDIANPRTEITVAAIPPKLALADALDAVAEWLREG